MGELQNLIGTVLSIEGRTVTIQPHHDDLNDPLPFQCHELQKAFKSSDHVKVMKKGQNALHTSIICDILLRSDPVQTWYKQLYPPLPLCSRAPRLTDSGDKHMVR